MDVRQRYGYLAWALDVPEVGDILRKAAAAGWGESELYGAISQTGWWKNTSSSARQWQQLAAEDPATASARVAAQKTYIANTAAKFGVNLDPSRLDTLATDSLRGGMTQAELNSAILSEFHFSAGQDSGQAAAYEQQFKSMAHDYLVPLSDQTLGQWVTQAVRQQIDPTTFQHYLIDQAKGVYQGNESVIKALDGGVTVAALADPFRQRAAKELGVSPDSIDFSDAKWSRALNTTGADGTRRMMTDWEWQQTLRTDSTFGFSTSANGRKLAFDATDSILKALGKLAG